MVNSTPTASIIILNWNNWQDTIACVESCLKLSWSNFNIIIVDNGSTDGSESVLKSRFPAVTIIQTGTNLGFAGGNNIGIRQALESGVDYIWLLNNDAEVAPEALTRLIETMETHPTAGIAGSKIYYHGAPRKIWFAGGAWTKGRLRLRQRGNSKLDDGQFDELSVVGSVSGCSMLLRSTAIEKTGLMDERYFLYWEDTDLCARAEKSGYQVLFVPTSHVWHKVSASVTPHSENQYYYYIRNGLFFCKTHDPVSLPLHLIYVTTDVLVGLLKGNGSMFRGYLSGITDFMAGKRNKRVAP